MIEKKMRTARLIYGICLSVLTVAVAVLFIVQAWAIFRSAEDSPYTVKIISEKFSQISVPFWLWIAAIAGGGVLSFVFPEAEEKPKALINVQKTLTRLKGRLPENEGGMVEVNRESVLRKVVWGVAAALSIAATVVSLVYLFDTDYVAKFDSAFFKAHTEAEKFIKIFPWVFASLCVCTGALIYQAYSLKKELSAVKKLVAESAKRGEKPAQAEKKESVWDKISAKLAFLGKEKSVLVFRLCVATLGLVLLCVGIFNGGTVEVLTKAILICKQCIGLG